ncbi:DUF6314 family protein [Halomonas sp. WWR20]
MTPIIRITQSLPTIRALQFESRSGEGSHCAWSGKGHGEVEVVRSGNQLRFYESGRFFIDPSMSQQPCASSGVPFRNVYRWELGEQRIGLYHERRGETHAVWLFDLVPDLDGEGLHSEKAHRCAADEYSARLGLVEEGFWLEWRIHGPRKNETLRYRYTRI